jgi:hypothetical protein
VSFRREPGDGQPRLISARRDVEMLQITGDAEALHHRRADRPELVHDDRVPLRPARRKSRPHGEVLVAAAVGVAQGGAGPSTWCSPRPCPSGLSQASVLQVTARASSSGMRSKCFTLAVPTRQPAVIAVAATSRSCAPTSIPDGASPAHRRACARAASRSNGNGGNAVSTPSTNAARRARCSGVARCTPWSSSDAVMAAIPTSSADPSWSSGAHTPRSSRLDLPEQARLR